MLVKEIMNKKAAVCTEGESLEKVFELMTETGADCISVVESQRHRIPIGTITEHDICRHVIGKGRNPRGLSAASVMNTDIAKANENLNLTECLNLMRIKSAKRVCVVDEDGMLCGMLTLSHVEKAVEAKSPNVNAVGNAPIYRYNSPGINRIF